MMEMKALYAWLDAQAGRRKVLVKMAAKRCDYAEAAKIQIQLELLEDIMRNIKFPGIGTDSEE